MRGRGRTLVFEEEGETNCERGKDVIRGRARVREETKVLGEEVVGCERDGEREKEISVLGGKPWGRRKKRKKEKKKIRVWL